MTTTTAAHPAPYFELRLCEVEPGRMAAAHRLMDGAMPALFRHAGIAWPPACWEGLAGPVFPLHACLIPWTDLDERMAAWKRLHADPAWAEACAAAAGRDGQGRAGARVLRRIDVSILRPSPAWGRLRLPGALPEAAPSGPAASGLATSDLATSDLATSDLATSDLATSDLMARPVGGIHELRVYDVLNQDPGKAHDALAETDLPFFRAHGAEVLGIFLTWFGSRMNQAVTLLAWPDERLLREAHRAHAQDPAVLAAREAERRAHGRPLVRGSDIHLLTPLSGATAPTPLSR